ncbi:hypothetical protein ACVWZZ_007322 [Bradyrhizobium sp. LM6.10]
MPAVSWPSEASFSVWTSRSWAARKSSSDLASSLVRSCTSLNSRVFSMAITAWSAKVLSKATALSGKGPASGRVTPIVPIATPSRSIGITRMLR